MALQLNDQSAEAWYYRAVALGQSDQVEACLTSLERAFALNPNRKSLDIEADFPGLWNNERFNQLLGRPDAGEAEEAILLPQVDLANLFDM
jgi:tetratricopeptide (TPR) repeat protein